MGRVQGAVEEAAGADKKKAISEAAGEAREAAEDAKQATAEVGEMAADVARTIEESAEKQRVVETVAGTIERAEEVKKEEKVDLLEQINTLREEGTVITYRLNAVLDELETRRTRRTATPKPKLRITASISARSKGFESTSMTPLRPGSHSRAG